MRGAVLIRLYFPDLDKEISWKMTLASGRIKDNRYLFCLMPESVEKLDRDYIEVLKVFNQLKGKKFTMNVRAGEKDVTAWYQEDLTIDLTSGMGAYGDWYVQKVPASMRNANTFYKICESNTDIGLESELTVKYLTSDSVGFSSKEKFYSCKKVPDFNFMKSYLFYAKKIDDNSFIVYQSSNDAWGSFSVDRGRASEPIDKRCPGEQLVKLIEDVRLAAMKQGETEQAEIEANKAKEKIRAVEVINNYAKNFKSKRIDPALENGVVKWWNGNGSIINPGINIYFLQPDFKIVRNDLGIVLHKTLAGLIIYPKNGKCYVMWKQFAYESLGGGVFDQTVRVWEYPKGNYYTIEGIEFDVNTSYEVSCSPLRVLKK